MSKIENNLQFICFAEKFYFDLKLVIENCKNSSLGGVFVVCPRQESNL